MKTIAILVIGLLLCSGCRSKSEIPATPSEVFDGTPSQIYERALPSIKQRLRSGTHVIRTDDMDAVVMRFSLPASDKSVRLVDVYLKQHGAAADVTVHSKKFTVVFGGKRDAIDREVEAEILALLKKRPNQSPEPTAMSVTPPAAQEPRQP